MAREWRKKSEYFVESGYARDEIARLLDAGVVAQPADSAGLEL